MKKKLMVTIVLLIPLTILTLVLWFYLSPALTTRSIPMEDTPELRAIQDRFNQRGYLTESDARRLEEIHNEQIKKLQGEASK